MSNGEAREQGRFEGMVLESLDNIEGEVGEIKEGIAANAQEIGDLKIDLAVHKGEQGRFEGMVLESLDNIEGEVGEIKEGVAANAQEIGDLKIGQAVHKEEHKRIDKEVERARRQNGNGNNGGPRDAIRVLIPAGLFLGALQTVTEIIKRVFGW